MSKLFQLQAPFRPTGDQPGAISALKRGLEAGRRFVALEGVTGSGKTFTMANVIQEFGCAVLVVSHNKTLAAQLYAEFRDFFPDNAVEYFVSYYDYYQPEAYIPQTDTFIEKDASINKEIERLRLSATNSLLSRRDVIVVASVSCIYGLGSPEDYAEMIVTLRRGREAERETVMRKLVDIQYQRNDVSLEPGTFRVRGDVLDVYPSYSRHAIRIHFFDDQVERIDEIDPLTAHPVASPEFCVISPATHFVMPRDKIRDAMKRIRAELDERVAWFERNGKLLEAQRLRMRTEYDMEMLTEMGYCSGIENYSRHLGGRGEGQSPATLLDYFPGDFLTVIDESHVTLPQLRAMYNGDQARKQTLVEHGFRLPSAKDNRPLSFDEFLKTVGQVVFMSATPGPFERETAGEPVRQLIRPTGLLDPLVIVRPLANQIDDLMEEIRLAAARQERTLVTTLTKKTAEDLSDYLRQSNVRVQYLHSGIDTLERVEILQALRQAEFDCLVGVNLLREGLDLPEVSLVAVLDADKEGFLRSATSLIQTAGRAARHVDGRVILYADTVTDSMRAMMDISRQRREAQTAYNTRHGITPRGVEKRLQENRVRRAESREIAAAAVVRETGEDYDVHQVVREMETEMLEAAAALEFERAAMLRDQIDELRSAAGLDTGTHANPVKKRSRRKRGQFRYPIRQKRRLKTEE